MRPIILLFCGFLTVLAGGFAGISPAGAGQPSEKPGVAIYRQRCQSCHAPPGQSSPMAPSLVGVVGRPAASGNFTYSAALRRSGLNWTRANLDRYLASPPQMMPGTRMVTAVPDAKQRADLIEYLTALR